MVKKLISIRIDEDLLDRIELIKENHNCRSRFLTTKVRNYYSISDGGYLSTAAVIEKALIYYFSNAPGSNTL